MDEDDLVEMVQDAVRKQRPYASFFYWPVRAIAEWGIANAFSESAASEAGFPLRELQARQPGDDPPDCEGIDAEGRHIGIEVTELVDGDAIARARRTGDNVWSTWDTPRIRAALDHLLTEKDSKTLHGGPYDEYLVLIHTDEPALTFEQIEAAVFGHSFPNLLQVQRAYILLSYDPLRRGYPYVKLL
jgi:hypothetical protein